MRMKVELRDISISKIVASNIIYLGKFRDIKIKDIEKKLDVSPGYISRCVKGNKNLSVDIAYRAALLFDVDIMDLILSDYEVLWKEIQKEGKIEELRVMADSMGYCISKKENKHE